MIFFVHIFIRFYVKYVVFIKIYKHKNKIHYKINTENFESNIRHRIDLLMASIPTENKLKLSSSDGKIRDVW